MVRIRVLGSLEAEVGGSVVPLGGPRQRAVLALLLAARGEVVSVDRLVDDLWRGEPPAQAVTSLQAYISNLRRLLEPGRPPRTPATIIVSASPGYAAALPRDAVDAWRFDGLLSDARDAAMPPAAARTLLEEGLSLWRGAAFGEFADESWAAAEVARLDELRLQASESLVTMDLHAGNLAAAVPAADTLTRRQPLREEGWRLLALALWGSNRQADALDALRRARRTLADELGLDPGPELAGLEDAILRQHRDVLTAAMRPPPDAHTPRAAADRVTTARNSPEPLSELFVGRDHELAALIDTSAAVGEQSSRIVLVSGEPGIGKSALLSQLRQRLVCDGWLVVAGQCSEADGAPPAWPWVQALRSLADVAPPPGELSALLTPLLSDPAMIDAAIGATTSPGAADASAGRFRLHHAVLSWLRAATQERRLAVVLDDLHWADAETLTLLTAIGTELTDTPLLLLAAYRATDGGPGLTGALAALARRSPLRLPLTGLPQSAVAELLDAVCRSPLDADTVTALGERTGGNPFYVQESARLLDSEGVLVALSDVPEGVRDVLRRRISRLPEPVVAVLRLAAVAGRDANVDVLVDAAATDEDGVVDALDAGLVAGLLTEPAPGRVRFTHALVRDTLVADLTRLRQTRMHAQLGAAVERLQPDNLAAIAHHYARAASTATAAKAVAYAVRAAESAEHRYAYDTAADLLGRAVDSFERIPAGCTGTADRDAERAELLGRLLRAQLRAGAVAAARSTRQRAIDLADAAGREDLLIAAFTAWTEPTPWQSRPYGTVDAPVVAYLTRLLQRPTLGPAVRCRLLEALNAELVGEGDPRARAAAEEAVALAAELGEPALRALALTALTRSRTVDAAWPERRRVADELVGLGVEQDLPVYRSFGGMTAAVAAAADGDVRALSQLVSTGLEFARAYRMPEAEGVGEYGQAMLAHIAGDLDDAEHRYTEATARMVRQGSLHADGFLVLAMTTLHISRGRPAEHAARAEELYDAHGQVVVDLLTLALSADGRPEQARQMHSRACELRPDFLFSTFAVLRAMAVMAVGDHAAAPRMYEMLLPLRDQLPGTLSLSLAMRPVAHTLAELDMFLGRPADAAGHLAHAVMIAERWGAAHWADDARTALAALTRPAR